MKICSDIDLVNVTYYLLISMNLFFVHSWTRYHPYLNGSRQGLNWRSRKSKGCGRDFCINNSIINLDGKCRKNLFQDKAIIFDTCGPLFRCMIDCSIVQLVVLLMSFTEELLRTIFRNWRMLVYWALFTLGFRRRRKSLNMGFGSILRYCCS